MRDQMPRLGSETRQPVGKQCLVPDMRIPVIRLLYELEFVPRHGQCLDQVAFPDVERDHELEFIALTWRNGCGSR